MDENTVPAIHYREGMVFEEPEGYVPAFMETTTGKPVDMARLRFIYELIVEEHPESERVHTLARANPGLNVDAGELAGQPMLRMILGGETIGFFDPRLLDA